MIFCFTVLADLTMLEVPSEGDEIFSALFNGPPSEYTAKLYVSQNVKNLTITAHSSREEIAITQVRRKTDITVH